MLFERLITDFVTLFVIIDPIGLAPLFVALTRGASAAERKRICLRALTVAAFLLAAFGLAGEKLLEVIGIGMPAFRISGGILLFVIAFDMLFERRGERREKQSSDSPPDPSVFPLAMPLLAGPGALATMILLTSEKSGDPAGQAGVFLMMLAVLAVTFVLFRLGGIIERGLGHTGIVLVTRLFGVLLAALAIQFVLDGFFALGMLGSADVAG